LTPLRQASDVIALLVEVTMHRNSPKTPVLVVALVTAFAFGGCTSPGYSTGVQLSDGQDAGAVHDSGSDAGSSDPKDGGGAVDTGSGSKDDADHPPEDGGESDFWRGRSDKLRASFVLATNHNHSGGTKASLAAEFKDIYPAPYEEVGIPFGPCVVTTYINKSSQTPKIEYRHAGSISVSGGLQTTTIKPAKDGQYATWTSGDSALWKGDEQLTFKSEGGEVPAFSVTFLAPQHVQIKAPSWAPGVKLMINRNEPLLVAWDGKSQGELVVKIVDGDKSGDPPTKIECLFDGTAGKGSIPSSALSKLDGNGIGAISAQSIAQNEVKVGEWGVVQVRAASDALSAMGESWGTEVIFQ